MADVGPSPKPWQRLGENRLPASPIPIPKMEQNRPQRPSYLRSCGAQTLHPRASILPAAWSLRLASLQPSAPSFQDASSKIRILLTLIYSATSKFLIDNFLPVLRVGAFAIHSPALAEHGPLARPEEPRAAPHFFSNRKICEKLEILVSHTKQTLGSFLIVKKMHVIQGAAPHKPSQRSAGYEPNLHN